LLSLNFDHLPFLSYVQAIFSYKYLKFQASGSSIDTNGAIGFGEKKKEEREGRRRRLWRG
jgi:hypothetical protein